MARKSVKTKTATPRTRRERASSGNGASVARSERAASPIAEPEATFDGLRIGRRRQHTLELTLARGSITDVDARALVLGIFPDVAPAGPAKALDGRLGGAITEFTQRRMFGGNVGETFLMPVGRSSLLCDMILFAGMGSFDRFNSDVQQLVAENVVRIFVRTRVEEFATVLVGAGSGRTIAETVANMATGFVRGLLDADSERRFRRIFLCERDPKRFGEMREAVYSLAKTPLFEHVELTLDECVVEERGGPAACDVPRAAATPATPRSVPAYLFVRQSSGTGRKVTFQSSYLGAAGPAAVPADEATFEKSALDALLAEIDDERAFGFGRLPAFGRRLAELVLPASIRRAIERESATPLVLVHDAGASRVPWETIHLGSSAPSLAAGLTRRYTAEDLSVAKWLEKRRRDKTLDILLVVNPTGDLPGADEEGRRLREAFGAAAATVRITELRGRDATREKILGRLKSAESDVLHYAGHASFDERSPERSGILCHGHERVTGADLAAIGNLPCLVFFNACEAARVRKSSGGATMATRVRRTVSFAEAFLRGGVANFVGTYWPVGDDGAKTFASRFYAALLGGATIGAALLAGRKALHSGKLVDWADYVFYGSPEFALKDATS